MWVNSVVFRDLTTQDLAKLQRFKVMFGECLDSIDNGWCPCDGEWSETILLIKESVHVLFHSLPWEPVLGAFLVEFAFCHENLLGNILHLPHRQLLTHPYRWRLLLVPSSKCNNFNRWASPINIMEILLRPYMLILLQLRSLFLFLLINW